GARACPRGPVRDRPRPAIATRSCGGRQWQARANARPTSSCRVDLEVAAGECHALLHAQQALAPAVRGALACGGDIETAAIVVHHEAQRSVGRAELYVNNLSLRVADDVRECL